MAMEMSMAHVPSLAPSAPTVTLRMSGEALRIVEKQKVVNSCTPTKSKIILDAVSRGKVNVGSFLQHVRSCSTCHERYSALKQEQRQLQIQLKQRIQEQKQSIMKLIVENEHHVVVQMIISAFRSRNPWIEKSEFLATHFGELSDPYNAFNKAKVGYDSSRSKITIGRSSSIMSRKNSITGKEECKVSDLHVECAHDIIVSKMEPIQLLLNFSRYADTSI